MRSTVLLLPHVVRLQAGRVAVWVVRVLLCVLLCMVRGAVVTRHYVCD